MSRKKNSHINLKKAVSYVCLLSVFMDCIPANALSKNINEISLSDISVINKDQKNDDPKNSEKLNLNNENNNSEVAGKLNDEKDNANLEKSENLKENSGSEGSEASNNDKENTDKDTGKPEELVNNIFNTYIAGEDEVAFSIGFNIEESKFVVKDQSTKELAKDNPKDIIYKIYVYDKKNNKKISIDLLGSDTGNTEKLKVLSEAKYEIGDFIEIIPLDPKNGLKILGDIKGDIDKTKEDYSDGVDDSDYIHNVRFEITDKGLKSIYNKAPVINGLSDVKDIKDKNINPLEGIVVTDDHDGTIDNSKVLVEVEEKSESEAVLKYIVEDSWGRSTSGTRKFYAAEQVKEPEKTEETEKTEEPKKEDQRSTYTASQNSLADNEIIVEGVPYVGNRIQRFKIKLDPVSRQINVVDDDGRMLNNLVSDEYFKFQLYSKDMELKASVTLLGTDKSDSEKLDAINNLLFEEGDYIGIWHAESTTQLKIAGEIKNTTKSDKVATPNGTTTSYANGVPQAEISERRFRIKNSGLELVENDAPVITDLPEITVARGTEPELLKDVNKSITDDFDTFSDDEIENEDVFITHTPFDKTKVGEQTITYTATDSWGRTGTKDRKVTVTSENPLDNTYIEFMKSENESESESLFKIRIDPVIKELFVEDIDSIEDIPIDSEKNSSIFKLKIYTQGGVLQKTLNIKGTDNLKSALKKINGYKYNVSDRIELWSSTPKKVRVIGELLNNNGENKEDYSDGIDNIDYMNNVRFEIGEDKLKYIYNKAPVFEITEELAVDRNGEVDLKKGITATDDYDTNIAEKIIPGTINTSTIGEKYVEYKVVDSWGRSTVVNRKVTVYPYNNLEYNYITIKNDETKNPIISIRFDDKLKKLQVNNIDLSNIPSSITDNQEVFSLTIFRNNNNNSKTSNGETKTFTKADLKDKSKIEEINDLSYEHGDYISLNVYDSSNGILISGKSDIVSNGFDSDDQMNNSRFKIEETGLKIVYNNAPVFSGLENKLYVFKGQTLEEDYAKSGITANDDIDETIGPDQIQIVNKDSVKTNELGDYKLQYNVTDSWGRTTSKERAVSVISKSVSNDIEFYNENGSSKLFSLKYNPIKNGFDVIRDEESSQGEQNTEPAKRTSENNTNQQEGGTPPTEGNNDQITEQPKVFKLGVYNTEGNKVGKLELSEDDITNTNSDAFAELENISVHDGYYFSVWSDTSSRIRIQGDMTGKDTLGEAGNEYEDYSEGINNDDHMNNVRFKLGVDGLEAVYNKAPKIYIKSRNILNAYAGDEIDYLSNVVVLDDHDGEIPKENVEVEIVERAENEESEDDQEAQENSSRSGEDSNSEEIPNTEENQSDEENPENSLVIGKNMVNLTVKDSWGRESTIPREIIISNGIDKNEIVIVKDANSPEESKALGIGFNHETKKLILDTYDITFGTGGESGYFTIKIDRPNEGGTVNHIVPKISFRANQSIVGETDKRQKLEEYTFQYGDIIEIYHGHPDKFGITGKVIDSREDYTDGVQNPENLISTKFEITPSGLKAIYTNPDESKIANNKNIIGPMAPEKFPFKLQVDPVAKKINVIDKTRTMILYGAGGQLVYKMVLIGADGSKKKETSLNGNEWGDGNGKIDGWNNVSFDYNDALYLWHKEPSRSIIKGNIKNQREDYSDGVNDIDNMNNVVFKLTETGLESVYNEAPKIIGAEDKDIYIGTTFNPSQGVTYTDDYDNGHLTKSISGTVDPNRLGEQNVTYTATDRWGKTTTVTRKITVRPNLYKNIFKIFSDNNNRETPNNDNREAAFEIGFDSVNSKYIVFNQNGSRLSESHPTDVVFSIEVKGADGNVKSKIDLIGNDRGDSPKLEALNKISYDDGDIIRVYRSNLDAMSIVGDVSGDKPTNEQMNTEENKLNYMLNTGFVVSESGLRAKYNKAPSLTGIAQTKTVTKGDILNLLDGVSVSDEIDTSLSINNIVITINGEVVQNKNNYTFDKLGTYNVQYAIQDSWGRAVLQEATISVESKVKENSIDVYDSNNSLAFKVKFNVDNNTFVLEGPNSNSSNTYNTPQGEDKKFEMVVRDIKGKEKYKVTLSGNVQHDKLQLAKINNQGFSKYDTISLYGNSATMVKIEGGVLQKSYNYADGFGSTDKYSKVRFKITDDGLTEMTNKELEVSGLGKASIKRGDEFNFEKGVVVDVKDTNNEDYKITVNSDEFNPLKEGSYDVTYTITNSWGTTVEQTRKITVEPRNKLEEVKLTLKNDSGQEILKVGFDSIKKKFRVLSSSLGSSINSNDNSIAFILRVYDSFGKQVGNLELRGNDVIDDSIVTRINNVAYLDDYSISIWAKNPKSHLKLEGDIQTGEKFKRRITDIDKMDNGRLEILTDGLKYIYNNAPEIIGGTEVIDYYKGTILNVPDSIKVTDDHDSISVNDVSIDDDQVDYDILGEHPITYKVEDSWGRVSEKSGKINIKSAMDSNEIDIYPISNARTQSIDKAFSIKFIGKNNENKIIIGDKSSTQFDSTRPDETFMKIKIYGTDGKEIKKVELLGSDSGTSDKLNEINNYTYTRGQYIAIEDVTDETKSSVVIHGTVVNQKEDYNNGVENIDYIKNVRFKFTDLGLESVYNEAPRIVINDEVKLSGAKGDDIPYMRGVKLLDDHDKLTKSNVEVSWKANPNNSNSKTIEGEPIVGENKLHYKVIDSWGRSTEADRNVTLTNGIKEDEIHFTGYDSDTQKDVDDVIKIKFTPTGDNQVTMSLECKDKPMLNSNETGYYKIKLYEPNSTTAGTNIGINGHDRGTSNKLDQLKGKVIQYGTKIELYAGHPDRLKISGPVRDSREDYSDGVQNPENYSSVKFEVTDSGLKSIYTEADRITDNENIIALAARESLPLKFKVNPATKSISIYARTTTSLQWELGAGIDVFRMTLHSSDGTEKRTVTGTSRDKGDNSKFNAIQGNYEFGDYLTIWHKTPSRIIIKGDVENAREDYSNGVDNSANLEEAIFRLTEDGIEAVYKSAPKIRGANDARVLKGGTLNLREVAGEVTAQDTIDGDITRNIQWHNGVDTGNIGLYEVTYEVTNSNQRTTRKSSTVQVYANPVIEANEKKVIELHSVENNPTAIEEYLKTAVTVTDEEDTRDGKKIKLELVSNNVNPDVGGSYTATYRATDSEGGVTEKAIDIQVVRTINVSVPTTIPFQVVTNLMNSEADPFVSGIIKLENNKTSDVTVSLQSFNKKEGSGDLQIVDPTTVDWNDLSVDESMNKMSLGLYHKGGLDLDDNIQLNNNIQLTKEHPLWLKEDISETRLGVLRRAENLKTPYTAQLSFTSEHGKKFKGGKTKGKFELIFKFE